MIRIIVVKNQKKNCHFLYKDLPEKREDLTKKNI